MARSLNEYGLQNLFDSQITMQTSKHNDSLGSDGGDLTPVHQSPTHQKQNEQQQQQDTWFITPLPSLVSLSTSQRSIVDTGALENLLIEHPSMSVFISVGDDDLDEQVESVEEVTANHRLPTSSFLAFLE
jgi:hypothetical protein